MLNKDILYLSSLHGVTGSETAVSGAVLDMLRPLADNVEIDRSGNVIGHLFCGKANAPKLTLSAHLDQVGLLITEITDEGFARVASVGADPRVILGTKFLALTDTGPLHCYSAAMPPHLQRPGDDEKAINIKDVWLDLGMDGADARRLVHPGDAVVFDVEPAELLNRRITGAALDDRAGVACILDALRELQGKDLFCDISVLFSTMEESNHQGCLAALQQIRPDYMIAVDVCHGSTLNCQEYDRVHELGCKAVIAFGMNSVPAFAKWLEETALSNRIPYEREALPGKSFTDAWVAQTTNAGICTAIVSIPLRHMHTPAEVLDLGDAEAVSKLLSAVCTSFGGLK